MIRPLSTSTSCNEWHTLFLIGIYTGLRLGDCCRLDWSLINVAQGVIQLVPRKTRRHSHGRPVTIPIHPALGAALADVMSSSRRNKEDLSSFRRDEDVASTAGQRNEDGGAVDLSTTTTLNFNSFSGPVLPMISAMYERGSWRVAHGLSRRMKTTTHSVGLKVGRVAPRPPHSKCNEIRHCIANAAAKGLAALPLPE